VSCRGPRLPSSTVFPYTTLFRSIQPTLGCGPGTGCCPKGSASSCTERSTLPAVAADGCCAAQPTLASAPWVVAQPRKSLDRAAGDRKSTRLNSSHLGSSYAGFCL